jgi:hypothetical protein
MGIGGFVLKDIAAFIAPGAYFMKGLEEESLKKYQPTNFLRRARIIQGQKDLTDLGPRIARRKSGGARNGEEASAMRRQEMEIEVSRKWESMQAEILAQKNKHQHGIRAALLGRSQRKGGQSYPRKMSRPNVELANGNGNLRKGRSAPIQQANGLGTAGLRKGRTAPDTSLAFKERNMKKKRERFDLIPPAVKDQAKHESTPKRNVPNGFEDGLQGNGKPVTNLDDRSNGRGNENMRRRRTSEDQPRMSEDTRPRATSDTMDWAAVKQGVV